VEVCLSQFLFPEDFQPNAIVSRDKLIEKEADMTLCIAAECRHDDKYAIVLCRDWQANKGQITSDDADKSRHLDEGDSGCRILLAGSPTTADHLLMACDPLILEFMREKNPDNTDIDTDRLVQKLRAAAKGVRGQLIRDWVFTTLNIEFDDFRVTGKNQLLESHYHDVWETIKRYDMGAELLITLFDAAGVPVIMRVDGYGDVYWENEYSIIGAGGSVARAFLCQVDYDSYRMSLSECIYEVIRAKFAAQRTREVGKGTSITVSVEGKKHYSIADAGFDYFENMLAPYKTPEIKFESSFLESDDDDDNAIKPPLSPVPDSNELA
jgi:hypothetical protein